MTKASLIALTTFVWTAAFAATGTLVRVVNHPLRAPPQITTTHLNAAILEAPKKPEPPPTVTITMPTVEILTTRPAPKVRAEPSPPPRVHCHEWRTLGQGSAVQMCD